MSSSSVRPENDIGLPYMTYSTVHFGAGLAGSLLDVEAGGTSRMLGAIGAPRPGRPCGARFLGSAVPVAGVGAAPAAGAAPPGCVPPVMSMLGAGARKFCC